MCALKMNYYQQYSNFNPPTPKPTTNNNASAREEVFSRKVFLGGLPLSIEEYDIKRHFEK